MTNLDESARLAALASYYILDSPPEEELDEIAEIASAICDTPISLVSLVDDHRQWFKAKKGLATQQTPREHSFCQYALHSPNEVLVVDDPLGDERFKNNPLVLGDPYIRFYAGAPLITDNGLALGTLCVIDRKSRTITVAQKKALQLLAKRVVKHFETRRTLQTRNQEVARSAVKLRKLTDQAPGAIYQFEMKPDGQTSFSFMSQGMIELNPLLDAEQVSRGLEAFVTYTYPDDVPLVRQRIQESFVHLTELNVEYRTIMPDTHLRWQWAKAHPERMPDGTVVWYGTVQDITERKEYIDTLEQMLYDVSHVLRRPVATLLGLVAIAGDENLKIPELREYIGLVQEVTEEMDVYLKRLNRLYTHRKEKATRSPSDASDQ